MSKLFTKIALAAGVIAALPSAAQAGTSTATGTATLTVMNQCTVTGSTLNLGTYTTTQTWGDVAATTGYIDLYGHFQVGTRGLEYLNFGSVTCDAGVPYTLTIMGSNRNIQMTHNGKNSTFVPLIKKLGGVSVADNDPDFIGAGANVANDVLSGTGTGGAQALLGSVALYSILNSTTAYLTDQFGVAGVSTDTLTYTLTF